MTATPLTWRNEKRVIGTLVEWEKNPRQLTEKQAADLHESLKDFGYVDPIAINTDGRIVGGHMRRRILLAQAMLDPKAVIDVRVPNRPLTEKEFEELAIRLNRNTGGWDFDKLANEFSVTDLLDWGFTAHDFTEDDPPAAPSTEETEDVSPASVRVKLGDVWSLGQSRLICGDAVSAGDIGEALAGEKVDVAVVATTTTQGSSPSPGQLAFLQRVAEAFEAAEAIGRRCAMVEPDPIFCELLLRKAEKLGMVATKLS